MAAGGAGSNESSIPPAPSEFKPSSVLSRDDIAAIVGIHESEMPAREADELFATPSQRREVYRLLRLSSLRSEVGEILVPVEVMPLLENPTFRKIWTALQFDRVLTAEGEAEALRIQLRLAAAQIEENQKKIQEQRDEINALNNQVTILNSDCAKLIVDNEELKEKNQQLTAQLTGVAVPTQTTSTALVPGPRTPPFADLFLLDRAGSTSPAHSASLMYHSSLSELDSSSASAQATQASSTTPMRTGSIEDDAVWERAVISSNNQGGS